ncbi:MAG: hypothetical protein NVS4B8_20310 [Herpetosiphon sp.]
MAVAVAGIPEVVHETPGRVRVHLPTWPGAGQRAMEMELRQLGGVQRAQANPMTSNVLIQYDPKQVTQQTILGRLGQFVHSTAGIDIPQQATAATAAPAPEAPPPVIHERSGQHGRARIAVRGIDRNPLLAQKVVERLSKRPGVLRVTSNTLTSRVLVEFNENRADIEDLVSEVAGLELPSMMDEDRPLHPLDPGPLIQSVGRTIGASMGLGLLAARRLFGLELASVAGSVPAQSAAAIGLLQSFPATRNGFRAVLGRNAADLLFQGAGIITQALAGSPLGLAVNLMEGLRVLTTVVARRAAWRRYEERLSNAPSTQPGAVVRLESGDRITRAARVIEGKGTATGTDGLPMPVAPNSTIPAGSRLYGGPWVIEVLAGTPFEPQPRPAPVSPSFYHRYIETVGPVSLAFAAIMGILTRSPGRAFSALLLVNPRAAMVGKEGADLGATARVLRAGVTVVGTRPDRAIRLPNSLLFEGPRVLTDGLEIVNVVPQDEAGEPAQLFGYAAGVAAAAGAPWSGAFLASNRAAAEDGSFDGHRARATVNGVAYVLRPLTRLEDVPSTLQLRHKGNLLLQLEREQEHAALAIFVLRPRLGAGATELIAACKQAGVKVAMVGRGDMNGAKRIGHRLDLEVLGGENAVAAIRERQSSGELVAFVGDSAEAAEAFEACDLAIGLTKGRNHFSARADLLTPDLHGIAAVIEAGVRRAAVIRDSVGLSLASNIAGMVWGLRSQPPAEQASTLVFGAVITALTDGWYRLRGGKRTDSVLTRMADSRPERWGRRSVEDILRELKMASTGLTSEEAQLRQRATPAPPRDYALLRALLDQIRSPLTAILAAGAGFSLALGSTADVVMIGSMIVANALIGTWQEYQANQAAEAMAHMGATTARVLRDGQVVTVAGGLIVPGDVLVLAPGDRVAADARLMEAQGLEVDEAALTGESLPVVKTPDGTTDGGRVVLEGSDVTVGTGKAVVVAVGHHTRLGATAAALAMEETEQSPLGNRLSILLRQFLPLAAAGGAIVFGTGMVRGQSLGPQLALGASLALAAVPEGLPLLAGAGEAGVARRLAKRNAVVRRLSSIEALGRVDVACTDKTGTLTEGKLTLTVVADTVTEVRLPGELSIPLARVLTTAALASPHPDSASVSAHPTDVAVVQGALQSGLRDEIAVARDAEAPFDPVRAFHAALVGGRLCVKGAAEALVPRCSFVDEGGNRRRLNEAGRRELLSQASQLAGRGLRVLMVAEGAADAAPGDPHDLVMLGYIGISDPLRSDVHEAVQRCREAGIRVVMLTGDHPATATAIGREAGLLDEGVAVMTGSDIAELQNSELDERLAHATVVARITPLDKLRIVESLQRQGHTVAMTGDGVNDAPALRLADVGVAMGRGGTEVARQAADVVLTDDDFPTLVEALVEGRSFWRNIRRALGLLPGGNLGELGLMVGASMLGLNAPMITRQILAVNLITDALPAVAVALQEPPHRNLGALAREGTEALNAPLRQDVLRRGLATALPSLAAFMIASRLGGLEQARSVAFASIVATQLAQTVDAGRTEGGLSRAVFGAVAASAALMGAAFIAAPARSFLGLVMPGPVAWLLVAGATVIAVPFGRVLGTPGLVPERVPAWMTTSLRRPMPRILPPVEGAA